MEYLKVTEAVSEISLMKVLIIEDAPELVEAVSVIIERRWPEAEIVSTNLGEQGIALAGRVSPNVIVLDLALPDISGFDVLKRIRLFSDIPILILTISSDENTIVRGLDWGANDYIIKPFNPLELLYRLQVVSRMYKNKGDKPFVYGHLRFDPRSLQAIYGTNEIKISRTEGIILGQLMKNAGDVVTYGELAESIKGEDFEEFFNSIKVHIHNLREKLEAEPRKPELILNKQGVGYYLANLS